MTGEAGCELQAQLQARLQTLAQRIVEAARLAASAHLFESLGQTSEYYGRRVAIGGAGPVPQGDGAADVLWDQVRPRRTSREAFVTDDGPAVIPDRAAGSSRRPPRHFEPAD